jgi:hypothetical protein
LGNVLASVACPRDVEERHRVRLAFSSDGREVVTGFADGTPGLWDMAIASELVRMISLDGAKDWRVSTGDFQYAR